MYSGKDHQRRGTLFKEGAGGEELEGKSEKVEEEKRAEFKAADGGFSTACEKDKGEDEEHAQCTRDDVSDVGERTVMADAGNAAFGVDADGG